MSFPSPTEESFCIRNKDGHWLQSQGQKITVWGHKPHHGKPLKFSAAEAKMRLDILKIEYPKAEAFIDNYPAAEEPCTEL